MLRFADVSRQRRGPGPGLLGPGLLQLLLPEAEGEGHGLAPGEAAGPASLSLGAEEVRRGGGVETFERSVRREETGVAVKGLKMLRREARGRGTGQRKAGSVHGRMTLAHIRQAFDLQALGHLQERGKILLVNGDFAPVHELQESLHLVVSDIFEKDNWVLVRSVVEHGLKVRGAGRQDHLVGLQVQSVAGDRDIHESFMIEKILEDGKEIVLVVIPAETVLLWLTGCGDSHGSA